MNTTRKLFIFAIALFLFSCQEDKTPIETENIEVMDSNRPHSPYVFRSVLDRIPRIITFALSDDMWAAYKINECSLYKVWKGGVNFDGPVYTTHHGPQPTTIGDAYTINQFENPWSLKDGNGSELTISVDYKGHRFVDNQAELMYEVNAEGLDSPVKVFERPEASTSADGQPIFERKFTTENLPDGYKLNLKFNASSIVVNENISTDGNLEILDSKEVTVNSKTLMEVTASVDLNANGVTDLNTTFITTPTIINPLNRATEEKENSTLHPGAKLIAQNDCKTCHNKNVKTIGPAYVSVARKYRTNDENIAMLTKKVQNGGSGIWGEQVMNAHDDLPEADIKEMVSYILSLDADEEANTVEEVKDVVSIKPDESIDDGKLIPGAVTRIYEWPSLKNKIPTIPASKTPKYAGIMPKFDNISGDDFKGLNDFFVLIGEGYLHIKKSQEYSFRTWSDDGSRLSLNGQEIINNDGMHGTVYVEATVKLEEGIYPFKLSYMQGVGGKFLSMNWKPADQDKFTVVPQDIIYHTEDLQGKISDKVLPMANISKIPGDRSALEDVHPSFTLTQARPDDFLPKVGGIDFLSDGRMVVSTWDAAGSVFIVENHESGNPSEIKTKLIAQGLAEPLGVKVVDDRIFVMQKQEMTELVDNNGDDIIDEYKTLCDDWDVSANFHEFGFGLEEKDAYLYATLATAIEPGGASTNPQIQDRGKVLKVNIETGDREFIASGLRTPNGIGKGFRDEIYVADNQGDWLPSSKIVHVTDGAWFGSRSVDFEGTANATEKLPVVWLPQDEIGNSPSTPLSINIGPYKNQMIHSEVTHGGVKRVFVEEVDGQFQGALFRFIQGLEAGINRMRWSPDGALYVGGIGAPGNWAQTGKLWYGLQRLVYNGNSTFEMLAVRAKTNGVEIEFTEPLDVNDGWDPESYEVRQWYYKPTKEYGGPKLDEKALNIKSATVSNDRTKVFLELDDMEEGHVVYIRLVDKFVSSEGHPVWSTECWYTMNRIPENILGEVKEPPYTLADNTLTPAEKEEGWELLFDGESLDKFKKYRGDELGKSWKIQDNAIYLDAQKNDNGDWQAKDGGDIITKESFENYEFRAEWKIANCGNSGIIFNGIEDEKYDYIWQTGLELQILDNTCHPDTRYPKHRAGDLYDLIEAKYSSVNPAGQWNSIRIVNNNGQLELWQNGVKNVEVDLKSEEWKELKANSKFKDMADFGTSLGGHIALQDHGNKVWFKNIKIKRLK